MRCSFGLARLIPSFDAHSLRALLITLGSILRSRLDLQLEIKLYIKGNGHIVVTPRHFPALGIPAGLPLAVSLLKQTVDIVPVNY